MADNVLRCLSLPSRDKATEEDIEEIWEVLVECMTLYVLSRIQKTKGPVAFSCCTKFSEMGIIMPMKKVSNKTAYLESYIPNKDPRRE